MLNTNRTISHAHEATTNPRRPYCMVSFAWLVAASHPCKAFTPASDHRNAPTKTIKNDTTAEISKIKLVIDSIMLGISSNVMFPDRSLSLVTVLPSNIPAHWSAKTRLTSESWAIML